MVNKNPEQTPIHTQNLTALERFRMIYRVNKAKAQIIIARCYGIDETAGFDLDHIICQSHAEAFIRVLGPQGANLHGLEQLRPMSAELNRGRGNRINFFRSVDALHEHVELLRERLPIVLPTVEGISKPDPNFPLVDGLGVYFEFDPSPVLQDAQDHGDHYILTTEQYADLLMLAEAHCQEDHPRFEIDPTLLPLGVVSANDDHIRFDKRRLDAETGLLLMGAMHEDERTVLKLSTLLDRLRAAELQVSPYGYFLVIDHDESFKACLATAQKALGPRFPVFPDSAIWAKDERTTGRDESLRANFDKLRGALGHQHPVLAFKNEDAALGRFIDALENAVDEFAKERLTKLLEHKIPRMNLEDLAYGDLDNKTDFAPAA